MPHAALLATCAAALGVAGCGGGGGSSAGSSSAADASYLAAVTRAADATDRVPGYRFALTLAVSVGGKTLTSVGSGSVDERGSEGSALIEVEGKRIAEVIAKPYVYVQAPSGAKASVTHGKRWLRTDLAAYTESSGGGSLGGSSPDPSQELSYLKSAGTVSRVGEEPVRGVPSTHYHAIVYFDRFAAAAPADQRASAQRTGATLERITGSKTMPMDVWIRRDGRVSRIADALSLCAPEGRLQVSLGIDLFAFGRQPVVTPPPLSEVTDVSAKTKATIAKGLSQISCR